MRKLSMLLLALILVLTACDSKGTTQDVKKESVEEVKPSKIGGVKTGDGNVNLYGPGSDTENDGKIEVKKGFSNFSISTRNIPNETKYEIYSNGKKVNFELLGDVDTSITIKDLKDGENSIEIIGMKDDKVNFYRELIVVVK